MGCGNDKGPGREKAKKMSSSKCEEADGHQRAPLKESQSVGCSKEPYGVAAAANSKSRAGINGSTAMPPPTKKREEKREEKKRRTKKRQRIWLGFFLSFFGGEVVPDLEMSRT